MTDTQRAAPALSFRARLLISVGLGFVVWRIAVESIGAVAAIPALVVAGVVWTVLRVWPTRGAPPA